MTVRQPLAVEYKADTGDHADVTFWTGGFAYARYVRIEMPARALGAHVADPSHRPADPLSQQQGDVAVWQRVGTLAIADLIHQQKLAGIRTVMETDDDYTVMHRDHGWVERLEPGFPPDQACIELHRMVAGHVDRVIVSTPHLKRIYDEFNNDVVVCPNSVNPEDWPIGYPTAEALADERMTFAWIASSDHLDERAMAARAFEPLKDRDYVRCVWMGVEPFGTFREFIEYVPWTDSWHEWRKTALELCIDVGVAPLNDAKLNHGRSDLKALEYALLGALPVVQDHMAYATVGADIAMKTQTQEWPQRLAWCANHREDVKMRAQIAQATVLQERTIANTVEDWRKAVTFV